MSDHGKLHTTDRALLMALAGGSDEDCGLIEVTPEVMQTIGESLDKRKEDIRERFPKLVADCPYETRLAVTAWVMEHICDHAKDGGSFRYLIYSRMGFGPDAYMPLYCAGGMEISNEFILSDGGIAVTRSEPKE